MRFAVLCHAGNHFASDLCMQLVGRPTPAWVSIRGGGTCSCGGGNIGISRGHSTGIDSTNGEAAPAAAEEAEAAEVTAIAGAAFTKQQQQQMQTQQAASVEGQGMHSASAPASLVSAAGHYTALQLAA